MNSIHGAPSFQLKSDCVELAVSQTAGMLGPVLFRSGGSEFSPYALAPWQPHELAGDLPNLLKYLRGDFLCLPFGPQDEGDPHGDTANREWSLMAENTDSLHLSLEPGDVGGSPGKSSLFFLTASCPENGSAGARAPRQAKHLKS